MPTSRAVLVLGMHRSGTSAVARALAALGVDLGNDFLDAQPENPTGYWEDKGVVDINERLLKLLGLTWDATEAIDPAAFAARPVRALQRFAVRYCRRTFMPHHLWGFKDPRTVRLLPFWESVLTECRAQPAYVVAIRNPRSVAASLYARMEMAPDEAYRLWAAHMVPFLAGIFDRPMVTVDYDRLMREPQAQLERIARRLGIESAHRADDVERFTGEFLSEALRHSRYAVDDLEDGSEAARLARDAFLLLDSLAEDRNRVDEALRDAWQSLTVRFAAMAPHAIPPKPAGWFARIIGRRR